MPRRPTPPRRKPPHHTGRPWLRFRLMILERDGWRCQIPQCSKPTRDLWRHPPYPSHPMGPSVDLITPKSHGGRDDDPTNARAAHHGCNAARGNRTTTTTQRWTTEPPRIQGLTKGRGVG